MKTYTEAEIIEKIHSREEINFLAAAITPWHALGIDANIYLLQQQGIQLKGYIMIVSHPVTGTAINENNFTQLEQGEIEVVIVKEEKSDKRFISRLIKKYNKYNYYIFRDKKKMNLSEILYWLVPLMPSYELIPNVDKKGFCKKVITILVDEGLLTYLDTSYNRCYWTFRECGKRAGIASIWHIWIRNKFFLYQLERSHAIVYRQLFCKSGNDMRPNDEVINAYRKTLKKECIKSDLKIYENSAVINSNMLYELGVISKRIDIEIYRQICDIFKRINVNVVLKPHPREKEIDEYSSLECYIEGRNKIAQESIFASLETLPICLIGFDTTTLVSAKILFDIEGISLNRLLDMKYVNDKKRFQNFNKTFSSIVQIPETMDDFIQIIKNKKK